MTDEDKVVLWMAIGSSIALLIISTLSYFNII